MHPDSHLMPGTGNHLEHNARPECDVTDTRSWKYHSLITRARSGHVQVYDSCYDLKINIISRDVPGVSNLSVRVSQKKR